MQKELDTFKDTIWNSHRICKQKVAELPVGIPDHMNSFPQEYDIDECGMHVVLITIFVSYQS
jgi:ABC-type antimicrobial peptide transport system ATPase subunit